MLKEIQKYATEFLYLRDDELIGVAFSRYFTKCNIFNLLFYDHDFEDFFY